MMADSNVDSLCCKVSGTIQEVPPGAEESCVEESEPHVEQERETRETTSTEGNGDGTNSDSKGNLTSKVHWVICVLPCLVLLAVWLCLIVAYATNLGGDIHIEHVDHYPCELEVDAAGARRISYLIHQEEVKYFYLNLDFPAGVEVSTNSNIVQGNSIVWTFGSKNGTKHFLDLPLMYMVWSFGLLDHYTYRNTGLALKRKTKIGNCSLVLGTNRTTRAIFKALKEMTMNITREDNQIDKDVMKSVWCQTYKKKGIDSHFENFARRFRFYYSDLRFMCSYLDLSFDSGEYEVVTEETFRPFTRQWSQLAFVFSIVGLWFFPLPFSYLKETSMEQDFVHLGLSSPLNLVDVLVSPFKDCCLKKANRSTNKGLLWLKRCVLFIFLFVMNFFGICVSYIMNEVIPGTKPIVSDLDESSDALGRFSTKTSKMSLTGDAFPLLFYLFFSFQFIPYAIYCCEKGLVFPNIPSHEKYEKVKYKMHRSLFSFFPWIYVTWNITSNITNDLTNCKCRCCNVKPLVLKFFLIFPLIFFWIFFVCTLLLLFKSLMYVCMFFSFGILSLVTFPKFTSGIFIYIFTVVLFIVKCILYPGQQYHRFLTHIIDVMKKDETLKGKCRINEKGDYGINKVLFFKLVDEHKPMTDMFLKLLFELLFIVSLLIWTGVWIRDLNQWWEIATITNIVVSIVILNFPKILEIIFFSEHDDVVKLRVKKSVRKYYTAFSFDGIEQVCVGIKQACAGIERSYTAVTKTPVKIDHVSDGIEEVCSGIDIARDSIEDTCGAIEQSFRAVGEHLQVVAEQANRGTEQDVAELEHCTFRTEMKQTRRLIEQARRALHLVEIENAQLRDKVKEACCKLEQAFRKIKYCHVCSNIKQTRNIIEKVLSDIEKSCLLCCDNALGKIQKARKGIEHGLEKMKQCHVRIEIEQARQAVEELRGTLQMHENMFQYLFRTIRGEEGVRELLVGLKQVIEGLCPALDGLHQTLDGLEHAHDKQFSDVGREQAHGEHSSNDRVQALDGLNKAFNELNKASEELIKSFDGLKEVRRSRNRAQKGSGTIRSRTPV